VAPSQLRLDKRPLRKVRLEVRNRRQLELEHRRKKASSAKRNRKKVRLEVRSLRRPPLPSLRRSNKPTLMSPRIRRRRKVRLEALDRRRQEDSRRRALLAMRSRRRRVACRRKTIRLAMRNRLNLNLPVAHSVRVRLVARSPFKEVRTRSRSRGRKRWSQRNSQQTVVRNKFLFVFCLVWFFYLMIFFSHFYYCSHQLDGWQTQKGKK
jgi:hypothetical protein